MTSDKHTLVGELINDELMERGWTLADLAAKSGLTALRIREVVVGGSPMTKVVALGLSNAFGTSMEFWINLNKQSQERRKGGR